MDWANESYVRIYKRWSNDLLAIPELARLCWYELIRYADLAGVIDIPPEETGVLAMAIRVSARSVEESLPILIQRGMVIPRATCLVLPNYDEAQFTPKSDNLRKRESRQRHKVQAMSQNVTDTSRNVTDTSQNVTQTSGELEVGGQNVHLAPTSLRSVQCSAVQDKTRQDRKAVASSITRVVSRLNQLTGSKFKPGSKSTSEALNARLADYTELEILTVVEHQCKLWKNDPKMSQFLRPKTLFGPENFENYAGPALGAKQAEVVEDAPEPEWDL